jgi:hypothetical protein
MVTIYWSCGPASHGGPAPRWLHHYGFPKKSTYRTKHSTCTHPALLTITLCGKHLCPSSTCVEIGSGETESFVQGRTLGKWQSQASKSVWRFIASDQWTFLFLMSNLYLAPGKC